jgi:SAM-dependent methyltransferase
MMEFLRKLNRSVRSGTLHRDVLRAAAHRIDRVRTIRAFPLIRARLTGKRGLEVGGPSQIFLELCPVYEIVGDLTNAVFSSSTIWEGERAEGKTFRYHPKREPGWNCILDGSNLHRMKEGEFDFVLSSHNLEHFANPVKALNEWRRVIRLGGHLLVVVPNGSKTFDHKRPVTPIEHMLSDYINDVGEDDLTHLREILQLHDLALDPQAGQFSEFEARSRKNHENRCLHHHVFDTRNAAELLSRVGFKVLAIETAPPHHIFLFAEQG